jgi:hypothetical protein
LNEKGDHDDEMHLWRKRQNDLAESNPDRRQRAVRLGLVLRSGSDGRPVPDLCRGEEAQARDRRYRLRRAVHKETRVFEVGLPRITTEHDYITADLPRRADGQIGPYCLAYALDGGAIKGLQGGPLAGKPKDAADNLTR